MMMRLCLKLCDEFAAQNQHSVVRQTNLKECIKPLSHKHHLMRCMMVARAGHFLLKLVYTQSYTLPIRLTPFGYTDSEITHE